MYVQRVHINSLLHSLGLHKRMGLTHKTLSKLNVYVLRASNNELFGLVDKISKFSLIFYPLNQ